MHSVKKTDPNDVRFPALHLTEDLLPEALRMKDKARAQMAWLTQTSARLRSGSGGSGLWPAKTRGSEPRSR